MSTTKDYYLKEMEEKSEFDSATLEDSLFFAQQVFERALCPFFPVNETARQIKYNEHLKGDKITLGVKESDLLSVKHILPEAVRISGGRNIDIQDKKIHIEYKEVPIEVRIITKHYRVLDFLDPVFYAYDTFYLPNPFDLYWRMSRFMH